MSATGPFVDAAGPEQGAGESPASSRKRRQLLAAGAAALTLGSRMAAAQSAYRVGPPPHEKGPRVFLDYDQQELDAAYDQLAYAPNAPQILKRWESNSALSRQRLGAPLRLQYGKTEIERLNIFRAAAPNAPVFLFIHGGAWRSTLAENTDFLAEMFVDAGAHYVAPDFSWVQDAGGSLMPIADQIRRAVLWTYQNAARIGADPQRIYVAGHSSGGHMAGVVLTTDWQRDYGVPGNFIRGGLCMSGMYDLAPVRLSARSSYVKFDDAMVAALSPIRRIDRISAPMLVAYGTNETPEFQRQNLAFARAIEAAGKPVKLLVAENYGHFEIPENCASPYLSIGRAALEMMGLQRGQAPLQRPS